MSQIPLQKYAVVDVEATGGAREVDRIIEIAIVLVDDGSIHTCFSSLVHPGISIPPFISKLTGISNEMVVDAPPFHMIAKKIVEYTEGRYLVAHNATFDYRILREEYSRLGYTFKRDIIDTQRLAKELYPDIEKYNLKSLAQHFGLDQQAHHRAREDAYITAELLVEMLARSQDRGHEIKAMGLFARKSKLPLHVEEEQLLDIPNQCGIYYMLNEDGIPVYIGKSLKIRSRLRSHFQDRDAKSDKMRQLVHKFDYKLTGSELMAEIVESMEIRRLQPLLNKAKRHPSYDFAVVARYVNERAQLTIRHRRRLKKTDEVVQWFPARRAAKNHIKFVERTYGIQLNAHANGSTSIQPDEAPQTVKDTEEHNEVFQSILADISSRNDSSFLLADKGMTNGELAVFHVESGVLKSMGYVKKKKWKSAELTDLLSPVEQHTELDRRVLSYVHQGKYKMIHTL